MRKSARKTTDFGILLIFAYIFLLHMEPLFADEPPLSEELLLSEESRVNDESLLGDESPLSDGSTLSEEPLLSDESTPSDELIPGEELPLLDESTLSEEAPHDKDLLLSEESTLGEESLPDGEAPLSEESTLSKELVLDDDSLVFEAPPLIFEVPAVIYETRSFDAIFPNFSQSQRSKIFSEGGLKHSFEKGDAPILIPDPDSGIDLLSSVMKKNPSHIIEVLLVAPYNEIELDMLDIYNALGRIENMKDQSIPWNGRDVNLFVESTRLESAQNRKPISDPPLADTLPYSETMYLRLKEASFGNLFVRGDVSISLYGITYSMTNFTDVRFFLIPVMKAERFSAIIYLEPVKEGVLIYSMSGIYLPGFIADSINLTPNINRRITVLINWITDNLRIQESRLMEQENKAQEDEVPEIIDNAD